MTLNLKFEGLPVLDLQLSVDFFLLLLSQLLDKI